MTMNTSSRNESLDTLCALILFTTLSSIDLQDDLVVLECKGSPLLHVFLYCMFSFNIHKLKL